MNTLRYRLASVKDAALLARLNARLVEEGADFGPADPDFLERRMRRWLAGGHNRGVLFEDGGGHVVAYAVYKEFPREIYLRQFLVLPAARCAGVGRQAFELLRSRLWSADKRLTLEVMSSNQAGYRFWRSLGYRDCALTLEIPPPCNQQQPVLAPVPTPLPAWAAVLLSTAAALGRSPLWLLRTLRAALVRAGYGFARSTLSFAFAGLALTPVAANPAVLDETLQPPLLPRLSLPEQPVPLSADLAPADSETGARRDRKQRRDGTRRHGRTLPAPLPAPDTISETELRAMRGVDGACPASVYRAAWSEARRYRMEPAWVAAMIEAESSCRADAVSRQGALGLMQLVPDSGARDAYRLVYGRDEAPAPSLLRDPQTNIRLGVAYLHTLRQHFARIGSEEARLLLAIASYNCGTDLFDQRLPPASAAWNPADTASWIAQHASHETRAYISQVRARAARYRSALLDAGAGAAGGATQTLVAAVE